MRILKFLGTCLAVVAVLLAVVAVLLAVVGVSAVLALTVFYFNVCGQTAHGVC